MYRSRGRNDFFPSLLLDGRSLEKGLEVRLAWREAEIIILNKLCQGFHPDHLELQVKRELSRSRTSGYRYLFLGSALQILANMRRSNQFGGLPTLAEYEKITVVRPHRQRFEIMMYERFSDPAVVRQYGGDYGIPLEASKSCEKGHSLRSDVPPYRAGSLDREYEAILREIREEEHRRVEEQYRANEEELRAELADAKFRAESVEARLDIQDQQLSLRPRVSSGPINRNNYIHDRSPRNRNYRSQTNDRSRYTSTEEGSTLLPDDTRSQRSFRPGFDNQGMPETKSPARPNQWSGERRVPEVRYTDGPRPNRDRANPPSPYPRFEESQARDGRRRHVERPLAPLLNQQLAIYDRYPRDGARPRRQERDGAFDGDRPTRRGRRLDGPRDEYPRDDEQRHRYRDTHSSESSSFTPTEYSRNERHPEGPRDRDGLPEMRNTPRHPENRREGPSDQYRDRVRLQRRNLDGPSELSSSTRPAQPRQLVRRTDAPHYHRTRLDLRVRRDDGFLRGYADTLPSTTESSYTDRRGG